MGNLNLEKKLPPSEQIWVGFFLLSSWIILSILLLSDIPKEILTASYQQQKNKTEYYPVLLENQSEKVEMPTVTPYISDKTQRESGAITIKRGFESLSEEFDLEFAAPGEDFKNEKSSMGAQLFAKNNEYVIQLIELPEGGYGGVYSWATGKADKIPLSMEFQKESALSWNRYGEPVIPTLHYKNYPYFRNMLGKIQDHWAPPGGNPYPAATDDFHSMNPGIPGRTTFQAVPSQEVETVFILDADGNVVDSKVISSLGYQSLDSSILDAIKDSKNFGPPPPELLKNGFFTMSITFTIY